MPGILILHLTDDTNDMSVPPTGQNPNKSLSCMHMARVGYCTVVYLDWSIVKTGSLS